MSYACPITIDAARADVIAIGAGSVQCAITLVAGKLYRLTTSGACWIKQGANPTASAAAGSAFMPANTTTMIDGALGAKIAVIQDATSTGNVSLCETRVSR